MDWLTRFNRPGNTLVEVIVAVAIFGIITGSLYSLFANGIELVRDNQVRITGLAVATQEIEIIKNLPFDDIGTIGGIPEGNLEQSKIETYNNVPFTIETDIRFVDDAYDGVTPDDPLNVDYKRVQIDVTWPNMATATPVTLVTSVAPNGIESTEGGGTLWIEVFDPSLEGAPPVEAATVSIAATDTTPEVSVSELTDADGRYILLGAPVGIEAYEVIVSKAGYSTARTYDRDAQTNPNPNPAHLSVLPDQVTTEYFQISELVDNITVRMQEDSHKVTICHFSNDPEVGNTISVDYNAVESHLNHGDHLGPCEGEDDDTSDPVDTEFTMHGEKTIGTDSEGLPIYKYSENHQTGDDGEYAATDIETDTYHIIYDEETEGYVIAGYSAPLPIIASPNTSQTITFNLADYEPYTELITVVDPTDNRLTGATVRLYDGASYDESIISYQYGQSFFSDLDPQTYNLEVSMTGYQTYTGTVTVNGNEEQTITLSLSS